MSKAAEKALGGNFQPITMHPIAQAKMGAQHLLELANAASVKANWSEEFTPENVADIAREIKAALAQVKF